MGLQTTLSGHAPCPVVVDNQHKMNMYIKTLQIFCMVLVSFFKKWDFCVHEWASLCIYVFDMIFLFVLYYSSLLLYYYYYWYLFVF